MGSGPAWNVEGVRRVDARRVRVGGMMRAEGVLDDAVVHAMTGLRAVFGIDEKALAADGTADVRGDLRWLT